MEVRSMFNPVLVETPPPTGMDNQRLNNSSNKILYLHLLLPIRFLGLMAQALSTRSQILSLRGETSLNKILKFLVLLPKPRRT